MRYPAPGAADRAARREASRLAATAAWVLALAGSALAQLPREDVIDVPAIGDGLCVSNLFQSDA